MRYSVGQDVRFVYDTGKYRVLLSWFDGVVNRYEIRKVVGNNLAGEFWGVSESLIKNYTQKEKV